MRRALEVGEIDGALLDTYVAAEYKEVLFSDKIYVKKILDRPFGYGVVLSGAAVNVEQRCREYIDLRINEIFRIIENMTKTLDVSIFKVKSVRYLTAKIVPIKTLREKGDIEKPNGDALGVYLHSNNKIPTHPKI